MKIILLIFTVLLPCKTNAQSTQDSSLYSNIKYVNGRYEREIECVFQGIGKNPIDGDTQGMASAIKKEIKEIPKSSVSLVYKEKEYYISIKNKCDTRGIPYGEKIKIRIIYFEKLRQPYDFTYPFAIITKIESCRMKNRSVTNRLRQRRSHRIHPHGKWHGKHVR